ncbi:MAG: hypothetical protein WDW38_008817 [Sanguina aurantia]
MAAQGTHTIQPFELERYFSKHEFTAKYLACCSDCEPVSVKELLALADADGLQRWENMVLGYTETQGLPALREEVARMYRTIKPSEVVVLAPEEGIYLTMRALLQPGDHVVVTYPGYQSLYEIALSIGCEVELWEPKLGPGGALKFEVETLQLLLQPNTRLLITNFPHNPTGYMPSAADWAIVTAACQSCGAYLFSDEMYRLMEYDPADRLPAAVDVYRKSISLAGVSKAFGLPGLRIGWVATHDSDLLKRILELKDYTSICPPAPSEILALIALRAQSTLLQRNLSIIRSNLQVSVSSSRWDFGQLFEWQEPKAGSIAFPRITFEEPIGVFTDLLVQTTGVLLLPATIYDHPPTSDLGHFRLGLGRRNLPECLNQLAKPLRQVLEAAAESGVAVSGLGGDASDGSSMAKHCVIS